MISADAVSIVAPATPWGRSALAVVRLSGVDLLSQVEPWLVPLRPGPWQSNQGRRVQVMDGSNVLDDGVAVWCQGPRTYTGEDTLEISCHGNPLVVERLVQLAQSVGIRLAEPGEFTRRALVNGKLDLLKAEAVHQVASASSLAGLAVARDAMDGHLGQAMTDIRRQLIAIASELEARLDWPSDELALDSDAEVVERLQGLSLRCRAIAGTAEAGRVQVHGARVALVGPVNAGKSSLFNRLLGQPRALVHDQPGTTRDVVESTCTIDGLAITLLDTAGERETSDPVEAAGLALGRDLVAEVDALIVVVPARAGGVTEPESALLERTASTPRLQVCNGLDRPGTRVPGSDWLGTSAVTGEGVDALKAALKTLLVGQAPRAAEVRIASQRQAGRLRAVAQACTDAVDGLPVAGVAVAADAVIEAIEALDALTGADSREDVLDAVFARFCIGK